MGGGGGFQTTRRVFIYWPNKCNNVKRPCVYITLFIISASITLFIISPSKPNACSLRNACCCNTVKFNIFNVDSIRILTDQVYLHSVGTSDCVSSSFMASFVSFSTSSFFHG